MGSNTEVRIRLNGKLERVGSVWEEGRGWFWKGSDSYESHGPYKSKMQAAQACRRSAWREIQNAPGGSS